MKKWTIYAIAILFFVLGFEVGWIWRGRGADFVKPEISAPATQTETMVGTGEEYATTTPSVSSVTKGENAVAVDNQAPGSKVLIGSVTLEETSWVAIHEEIEGQPGRILGARIFDTGTHSDQEVELLRGTGEGGTYYAMLHLDDGDRLFDHKKDLLITDSAGNPIMMKFVAVSKLRER